MIYILNTSILPNFGKYSYKEISIDEAKKMLHGSKFTSAVGHKSTADILTKILKTKVPVNRVQITLNQGDRAIVFKLQKRLPEGVVINSLEELEQIGFSFGLLTRTA